MSKFVIKSNPMDIVDLYRAVAMKMGYKSTRELHYDCTKINVAPNIQDNFYEYYAEYAKQMSPNLPESEINVSITMLLAMSGPKVDKDLKANEVEVFDGFIC